MTPIVFGLAAAVVMHPVMQDGEVDVAVQIDVFRDRAEIRYTIEAAEETIREELTRLGAGDPGSGLANVLAAYAVSVAATVHERLELRIDGLPATLGRGEGSIAAGHHAGVEIRLAAEFEEGALAEGTHTFSFDDANFLPLAEDGAPAWTGSYRLAVRAPDDAVDLERSDVAELADRATATIIGPEAIEEALASHATEAVLRVLSEHDGRDDAPYRTPVFVLAALCLIGCGAAYKASRNRRGDSGAD